MSYQAGDTYPATVTIRDEDGVLTDPPTLTLKVRDEAGTVTTYEYGDDAIIVRDSVGVFHADVLLTDPGMWVLQWSTTDEEQVEGVQVAVSAAPTIGVTFATLHQLALMRGYASAADMTAVQRAQGQMLLELATERITSVVGKTATWVATLNPIPAELRSVCLDLAWRTMQNPTGMSSESETLGAYSHTTRYEHATSEGGGGPLDLTKAQIRMCRRAVHGRLSASTIPDTNVDLIRELGETGEIAAFPAT